MIKELAFDVPTDSHKSFRYTFPWKSLGVMLTEERRVLWGDGGRQGGGG